MVPARIGVFPAREHAQRARLFAALEQAYPVRFEGRDGGAWRELDGAISIGASQAAPAELPWLWFEGEETRQGDTERRTTASTIEIWDHAVLARPLRGASLSEEFASGLGVADARGEHAAVLATLAGTPAWVLERERVAPAYRLASAPAELGELEALRERLQPGRCLALLGLVHFLRELTAGQRWELPPARAAFVIDDPNLRWPSYGHIDYPELLSHARTHGYHLSVAMIPLDGWFAHPRVTRMFREGAAQLSVCVHGNDHDGPELGKARTDAESHALAAQALRRADSFQRRTGVSFDRVMVAPHEQLSEQTARALVQRGFEAICATRPYPWAVQPTQPPWLQRPAAAGPLAGWGSMDVVSGGLPMLLRADFTHSREDLVLRAFLGQPLILYSHHDLFEHGLERLAEAAAFINGLGETRWGSLAQIARTSAETRVADGTLDVRMLTARAEIEVPAGVHELRVDAGALAPGSGARLLVRSASGSAHDGSARNGAHGGVLSSSPADMDAQSGTPVPVNAGGRIELRLEPVGLPAVPVPPLRLRPILRRLVTEGRDRAQAAIPQGTRRAAR